MSRQYKFVGDGAGVPGLPHLVTDEEAKQLGVFDFLEAAIANGNYAEVASESSSKPKNVKKESEVNDG